MSERPDVRPVMILGISGSGRKGSYNSALLEEARRLIPPGSVLVTYDVSTLPLFNQDLEKAMPPSAREFKEKVKQADAVLFAAPEYNHSVTAVMKNALEWGDRPPGENSWDGKPAAIVSASTSMTGGARAQAHLRQIFADVNLYAVNRPPVLIPRAQEKFSPEMRLTDEKSLESMRLLLAKLVQWALMFRGVREGAGQA